MAKLGLIAMLATYVPGLLQCVVVFDDLETEFFLQSCKFYVFSLSLFGANQLCRQTLKVVDCIIMCARNYNETSALFKYIMHEY